jgi:transposase-like protein
MCDLSNPIYHNKDLAREHLESIRWPNGPICPHCGVLDNAAKLGGTSHRPGLYKCRDCRKQFSVTVGTVFERSKIPLNKWLLATHLLTSSKKGISSHQIHRSLGVTYKTAWFMTHRIRKAMESTNVTPMGSGGGYVEADETYIGRKKGAPIRGGWGHKQAVLSLVERGGKVRSTVIAGRAFDTIKEILPKHVSPEAHLNTDTLNAYSGIGKTFASHEAVNHSAREWRRGTAHTNTIEGFFSVFKRGMKGIYQHCSEDHLHRYLSEFDFRYNNRVALEINDRERCRIALEGIGGKRLTYRRPLDSHA